MGEGLVGLGCDMRHVLLKRPLALSPARRVFATRTSEGRRHPAAVLSSSQSSSSDHAVMDVFVKAKPGSEGKILGDCPFSSRVLLTLEEKKVPHKRNYIDLGDKPQWFLEKNPAGKVPVVLFTAEGKWVSDSDVIAEFIEEKCPEPTLVPENERTKSVGSTFFGAFVKYFTNEHPENEAELKGNLTKELESINTALQNSGGPFLDGSKVCSVDLALYPKLRHMVVAAGHFKGFAIPREFTSLRDYMEQMAKRESVRSAYYPDEYIIEGWKPKVGLPSNL